MGIPGVRILRKTLETGTKIATNPAGFLVDQTLGRVIETDEEGKELPEIHAFQVKLDRTNALLAFIAEHMDPEGFNQTFGDGEPPESPTEETVDEAQIWAGEVLL